MFEIKMKALNQHKSHVRRYSNDFLGAAQARARHRGYEIGSKYAECFEVLRYIGKI